MHVKRENDEPAAVSKYEVWSYRTDESWGSGPFEFELERTSVLIDFQKLLPAIMASSIRFRSALKFEQIQEEPIDTLIRIGKKIYSSINPDVRLAIRNAESIHLFTNEIEVPWEIMYDDTGFLTLNRPFGISPMFKRAYSPEKLEKKTGHLRVLMIVDTKDNLPQTRYETGKIQSLMQHSTKVDLVVLEGEKATYGHVRSYLQEEYFDIVHVATHTMYEQSRPEDSGVVLSDSLLRTRDLYNSTKIDPPWLVFMNSCESAKTRDISYFEKYDELLGLAFAFVKAGARSYIGTIGLINDSSASEIAIAFYDNLFKGSTVGESLKRAKAEFCKNHPDDLTWSAFSLYGDPGSKKNFSKDNSSRDPEHEVRRYIQEKKGKKHFELAQCARDLNISISELRAIITRLRLLE